MVVSSVSIQSGFCLKAFPTWKCYILQGIARKAVLYNVEFVVNCKKLEQYFELPHVAPNMISHLGDAVFYIL